MIRKSAVATRAPSLRTLAIAWISSWVAGIWPGCLRAETIHIAVASNFVEPAKALAAQFRTTSGHEVTISAGSSGKFFAQIRHGAPYQAFFSADQHKPQALEKAGLTVPGSRFTYAVGVLALWSPKPGFIENNPARLSAGQFNKLALANPRHAPYGMAAMEVLQQLQLVRSTQTRLIQGENIAQAFQFVRSGNADLGFVALSQIMRKGRLVPGSAWIVPDGLHGPIRQDAVLLKRGAGSAATRAFLDFVRSDPALQTIGAYGYRIADP